MAVFNPREEIITLLRGQVSCPVLCMLGQHGILERMLQGAFSPVDLDNGLNRQILEDVLAYLVSLGLLVVHLDQGENPVYRVTASGKKVFVRYGSFCLLNSYSEYVQKLGEMLFNNVGRARPEVNREVNVQGCGKIHSKKFFPFALKIIAERNVKQLVDIACGDGQFLEHVIQLNPDIDVVAIDKSEEALVLAKHRIEKSLSGKRVKVVRCNGIDIQVWSGSIINNEKSPTIISMWFFLHEISLGNPEIVVNFLNDIYRFCPNSEILIGEITAIPPSVLAEARFSSIMPELLFVHALSGQHVLSLTQYEMILSRIPYVRTFEQLFDPIGQSAIPSAFLWHLKPSS